MDEDRLANRAIGAALKVHRLIGPGLLESAYRQCLAQELRLNGVLFQTEVLIGLAYKGVAIRQAFRADLLIAGQLIVELKAVDHLRDEHRAQLLTYLRWSNCRLGLLIDFHSVLLKNGIARVVNGL